MAQMVADIMSREISSQNQCSGTSAVVLASLPQGFADTCFDDLCFRFTTQVCMRPVSCQGSKFGKTPGKSEKNGDMSHHNRC